MNLTTATTEAPSGLVGTIGMRILSLPDLSVSYARSTAGIAEPVTGSGSYVWNGNLTIPDASAIIWDDAGAPTSYSVEAFGRIPVLQALTGVTYSIEILDLTTHAVLVPDTTVGVVEAVSGSGIYVYQGTVPSVPYMVVWHDGNGHYTTDECRDAAGTVSVTPPAPTPTRSIIAVRDVGTDRDPQEVKRQRRANQDMLKKMGQTVIIKHRWNQDDLEAGTAKRCPACYNSVYRSGRTDCPICFGTTFVSVANDDITNLWIEGGYLSNTDLGSHIPAPKYGGYGAGYVVYVIQPDTPVDVFRQAEEGTQIDTRNANGSAPWFPLMGDNDLLINVVMDRSLGAIKATNERYELKMVQPVTVRGFGLKEMSQLYRVGQTFGMARLPEHHFAYQVPVDR